MVTVPVILVKVVTDREEQTITHSRLCPVDGNLRKHDCKRAMNVLYDYSLSLSTPCQLTFVKPLYLYHCCTKLDIVKFSSLISQPTYTPNVYPLLSSPFPLKLMIPGYFDRYQLPQWLINPVLPLLQQTSTVQSLQSKTCSSLMRPDPTLSAPFSTSKKPQAPATSPASSPSKDPPRECRNRIYQYTSSTAPTPTSKAVPRSIPLRQTRRQRQRSPPPPREVHRPGNSITYLYGENVFHFDFQQYQRCYPDMDIALPRLLSTLSHAAGRR